MHCRSSQREGGKVQLQSGGDIKIGGTLVGEDTIGELSGY
jgi:hypothetical protein